MVAIVTWNLNYYCNKRNLIATSSYQFVSFTTLISDERKTLTKISAHTLTNNSPNQVHKLITENAAKS